MDWIWICLGLIAAAGAVGVGCSWAVDHGHQAFERVGHPEGVRIHASPGQRTLESPRGRATETLGSLSAFDAYMAKAAGG